MSEDRTDPLADIFTLFAAPLSGAVRSIDQFRKGVDEFLKGVENFNRTMENLNETAERVNTMLAEVEEPLRAAIPQITRTVKTADQVMQVVSGPAIAVAPGLDRLADTLSNPAFADLPIQVAQFSDVLGEITKRLAPLNAFAGSAGGLFGGLRVPGTRSTSPSSDADEHTAEPPTTAASTARKPTAKKRSPAKKTTGRKLTTTSQVAKKPTKKPASRRSAG